MKFYGTKTGLDSEKLIALFFDEIIAKLKFQYCGKISGGRRYLVPYAREPRTPRRPSPAEQHRRHRRPLHAEKAAGGSPVRR